MFTLTQTITKEDALNEDSGVSGSNSNRVKVRVLVDRQVRLPDV